MKPIITPYQFNSYTAQLTEIYSALELELFQQIARRLKAPPDSEKDYVLQWQVEKMQQLRMLNQETIEALAETNKMAVEEIQSVFREVGFDTIQSVDEEVKAFSYPQLPRPTEIDRVLESYVNQVFTDLDNYVNSTLISSNYGQGTVARTYTKIIEETTAQVLAGNKTINQVVAETVIRWGEKGIDTGFIDKSGRVWQLEHYADTVVRSTVNNTYNDLRMSRMSEYGIDLMLVNTYQDARPACAKIQGGVVSMKPPVENTSKYPSIYEFGYGTPSGIRGVNCRHILYPYIEGISENNQRQVDETAANERYKEVQKQRQLERRVRDAKRSLKLAETIGDDKSIEKYKQIVRNRQAAVREYISEHDLPRRYEKERVIA